MASRLSSLSRREFLQTSGILAAAGLALKEGGAKKREVAARAAFDVSTLEKFVDPLPIPNVLRPIGSRPNPDHPDKHIPHYRLAMREFVCKVHRDLKPTRMWGYGQTSPGPTFETRSGEGLLVEWSNELPAAHFLPVDHSVHGAERDKPPV